MNQHIHIATRFCGPPTSGNGGVSAGLLAAALGCGLGDAAEIRLHAMPPLDTDLVIEHDADGAGRAIDPDGSVVLSGRRVAWANEERRRPATWDDAVASAVPFDPDLHPYPTCFVCGPARADGDGLRLFAGAVPSREGADAVFAAPWVPDPSLADPADPSTVRAEIVWSALDCPSGQAVHVMDGGSAEAVLLGTIAAVRHAPVRVGGRYVATAWERAPRDGRKLFSACTLTEADTGTLVGESSCVWIAVPRS